MLCRGAIARSLPHGAPLAGPAGGPRRHGHQAGSKRGGSIHALWIRKAPSEYPKESSVDGVFTLPTAAWAVVIAQLQQVLLGLLHKKAPAMSEGSCGQAATGCRSPTVSRLAFFPLQRIRHGECHQRALSS